MKLLIALWGLTLLPFLMTAESANNLLTDLDTLQWSQRILLLFPGQEDTEALIDQLNANEGAIDERDIAWFLVSSTSVKTNYPAPLGKSFGESLIADYAEDTPSLQVVLIGKDGGTKNRYAGLDLPAVFARIDSMPMRQAEMRRR